MSPAVRIAAIVATVAILVAAFIAFSPKDEDTSGTAAATATSAPPAPTGTATTAPVAKPAGPKYTPIVVEAGRAEGGVQRIEVRHGDEVRLLVSSPDTSDEIHLHGYDIRRDLHAGGEVRVVFTADADGIFEMELEGAGAQIAEIVVQP